MASEFLIGLLRLRSQLKLYHWQTKFHSRHVVSGEFVDKISETTDEIIEAYQGRYKIIMLKKRSNIVLEDVSDGKIIDFLKKMRIFILDNAKKLFDKDTDGDLFNLRDELLQHIDIAVYLFNQK